MASADDILAVLTRIAETLEAHTEILTRLVTPAEHRTLPSSSSPPSESSTEAAPKYRIFDAETLHVTIDEKSAKHFKVKGGPFKEHGVTIWPEVLANVFGLDVDQLQPREGGYAFEHQVRALLTAEGKLRKVVGLAE